MNAPCFKLGKQVFSRNYRKLSPHNQNTPKPVVTPPDTGDTGLQAEESDPLEPVLQVGGIEALGEPVVDFGEHPARLSPTLLANRAMIDFMKPSSGDQSECFDDVHFQCRAGRKPCAQYSDDSGGY